MRVVHTSFLIFLSSEIRKIYSLIRPHRVLSTSTTGSHSFSPTGVVPKLNLSQLFDSDRLVIVEFSARKLAFVFRDQVEADRFKLCLQILVRYVSYGSPVLVMNFLHLCALWSDLSRHAWPNKFDYHLVTCVGQRKKTNSPTLHVDVTFGTVVDIFLSPFPTRTSELSFRRHDLHVGTTLSATELLLSVA